MKILQTNKLYSPHIGGIESVIRDIAENLTLDRYFESDVLVCQEKGNRVIDSINGVKIYRAASFGRFLSLPISFDYFILFKKIVKDYDLLLIHHPYPLASLARFLFSKKTRKIAVWYHSDIVRQKLFYRLIYPFLYLDLKAAKVIFVSSHRLAEKSPLLSKFLDKCQVIPFGVDLKTYQIDCGSEVNNIKLQYGRFMLAVGRLVYYKGYLDLLEAMKTAPGKLVIIGTGPLEEKLKKIISDNHLEEKIIIISSHPENLIPYYQACEFLVFPSIARSEAFGLVQIEAMACGKPVINTDLATGVPEVSLDQETGLTIPIGDTKKLSEAIKSLWENNDLYTKLSRGAKNRAELIYSKDKFDADVKQALIRLK